MARRRKERTAFVLSGGGNLGALQVGMLRALTEHGIVPDLVLGCSVGALNGATFARAPTLAGVERMAANWLSIDGLTLMPSGRLPSAIQLLRKGESLHGNSGLVESIETMLGDQRDFADLLVPFQCVATSVETSMGHWFTEGDLVESILASAALPAVYPPVTIDGVRYVDGGVVDNVPIARAVELGCTRIFVIQVGPHGRPEAEIRRPVDGALLAYWLARNNRFARDLAARTEASRWRHRIRGLRLPVGTDRTDAVEAAAVDPEGAIVLGEDDGPALLEAGAKGSDPTEGHERPADSVQPDE
jgi:NTE family protein